MPEDFANNILRASPEVQNNLINRVNKHKARFTEEDQEQKDVTNVNDAVSLIQQGGVNVFDLQQELQNEVRLDTIKQERQKLNSFDILGRIGSIYKTGIEYATQFGQENNKFTALALNIPLKPIGLDITETNFGQRLVGQRNRGKSLTGIYDEFYDVLPNKFLAGVFTGLTTTGTFLGLSAFARAAPNYFAKSADTIIDFTNTNSEVNNFLSFASRFDTEEGVSSYLNANKKMVQYSNLLDRKGEFSPQLVKAIANTEYDPKSIQNNAANVKSNFDLQKQLTFEGNQTVTTKNKIFEIDFARGTVPEASILDISSSSVKSLKGFVRLNKTTINTIKDFKTNQDFINFFKQNKIVPNRELVQDLILASKTIGQPKANLIRRTPAINDAIDQINAYNRVQDKVDELETNFFNVFKNGTQESKLVGSIVMAEDVIAATDKLKRDLRTFAAENPGLAKHLYVNSNVDYLQFGGRNIEYFDSFLVSEGNIVSGLTKNDQLGYLDSVNGASFDLYGQALSKEETSKATGIVKKLFATPYRIFQSLGLEKLSSYLKNSNVRATALTNKIRTGLIDILSNNNLTAAEISELGTYNIQRTILSNVDNLKFKDPAKMVGGKLVKIVLNEKQKKVLRYMDGILDTLNMQNLNASLKLNLKYNGRVENYFPLERIIKEGEKLDNFSLEDVLDFKKSHIGNDVAFSNLVKERTFLGKNIKTQEQFIDFLDKNYHNNPLEIFEKYTRQSSKFINYSNSAPLVESVIFNPAIKNSIINKFGQKAYDDLITGYDIRTSRYFVNFDKKRQLQLRGITELSALPKLAFNTGSGLVQFSSLFVYTLFNLPTLAKSFKLNKAQFKQLENKEFYQSYRLGRRQNASNVLAGAGEINHITSKDFVSGQNVPEFAGYLKNKFFQTATLPVQIGDAVTTKLLLGVVKRVEAQRFLSKRKFTKKQKISKTEVEAFLGKVTEETDSYLGSISNTDLSIGLTNPLIRATFSLTRPLIQLYSNISKRNDLTELGARLLGSINYLKGKNNRTGRTLFNLIILSSALKFSEDLLKNRIDYTNTDEELEVEGENILVSFLNKAGAGVKYGGSAVLENTPILSQVFNSIRYDSSGSVVVDTTLDTGKYILTKLDLIENSYSESEEELEFFGSFPALKNIYRAELNSIKTDGGTIKYKIGGGQTVEAEDSALDYAKLAFLGASSVDALKAEGTAVNIRQKRLDEAQVTSGSVTDEGNLDLIIENLTKEKIESLIKSYEVTDNLATAKTLRSGIIGNARQLYAEFQRINQVEGLERAQSFIKSLDKNQTKQLQIFIESLQNLDNER